MLRLGLVDCDTSHAVEFTKRLHGVGVADAQKVAGATVVACAPMPSKISPERVGPYVDELKKYNVAIVDKPTGLLGKIDAVLVLSVDGSVHRERAEPFLKAGLPTFVDKPFACSLADAKAMADLAAKHKAPLFGSSSLRYTPELVAYVNDARHGPVNGAIAYGPSSEHERNPGLFHYGIHATEILYTLMGPGCTSVTAVRTKDFDEVVGTWQGGRVGTVRGLRTGASGFGAVSFAKNAITHLSLPSTFIYRELLKQIVTFAQTGKSPMDINVTLEIVAFIEAGIASVANHGTPAPVKL